MSTLEKILDFLYAYPLATLTLIFIIIPLFRSIKSWSILARAKQQGGVLIAGGQFSVLELYESLKNLISDHDIKGLVCADVSLIGDTLTRGRRKYLKIQRGDIIFYVCSFRTGDAQAITYWQVVPLMLGRRMIMAIPLLGKLLKVIFFPDTLFTIDMTSALTTMIKQDIITVTKHYESSEVSILELPDRDAHLLASMIV